MRCGTCSTDVQLVPHNHRRKHHSGSVAAMALKLSSDIPYHLELQRRLLDIFRYVSCHQRNVDTHSVVVLESLLVDTCSFFDSLCQTFVREKERAGHKFKRRSAIRNFEAKISGEDDFNFGDYRLLFETEFTMSTKQVNLNTYEDALFSNPMRYLPDQIQGYLVTPFSGWAGAGVSPWWAAFTDLKHDRLNNFQQAKLGHVIYSMAAVFTILSLRNEAEFKDGTVSPELYELFCPKYWSFKGRVTQSNFTWK